MPFTSSRDAQPDTSVPTPPKLPKLIAIVDDHEGSRVGLAAMIQSLGCKVEAFESVRAFFHSHAMRRVDCIILDVAMPDIDGLTAQKGLLQTNYNGPIIFCSGYDEDEIRESAAANGAAYFLRKPLRKADLIRALQAAVEKSEPKPAAKSAAKKTTSAVGAAEPTSKPASSARPKK